MSPVNKALEENKQRDVLRVGQKEHELHLLASAALKFTY